MKLLFDYNIKHYQIDASKYNYGQLCLEVSQLLLDKINCLRAFNKPTSFVTISNLYNVGFTGKNKKNNLKFYNHSGYMGGLKIRTIQYHIDNKSLEKCVRETVFGMLSKTIYYKKLVKKNIKFI